MKKYTRLLLLASLVLLGSCGESGDNSNHNQNNNDTSNTPTTSVVQNTENPNILIAYFTWGDNTVVEDPSSINPNLSSSASVLPPGNTAIVASYIQEAVGGTLFSMLVKEKYSSNYDECLSRASDEKANNARPELSNSVENMDQYDTIFLGYPNWWYTIPMVIHTFIESYDLSGKTVIPFCCHGTGGLASSVRDLDRALSSDVNFIDDAFGVYRPNTVGSKPLVNTWLTGLGYAIQD